MKIATTLRGLAAKVTSFFGRHGYGFSWLSSVTNRHWDYNKEAGARYDNSAVAAAIQWIQRRMSEPRMIVERKGNAADWIEVDHEFPSMYEKGIAYDGTALTWATVLSLVVTGNAYIYKVRAQSRKVVGFLFMDYTRTRPMNDKYADPANPYALTTYYEFRNPEGQIYDIPPEDVIHIRFGINPADHRLGISPIQAALADVVTDNEAALLGLSLLKNGGIPGVAFEPAEKVADDMSPAQRAQLEELIKGRITGPGSGRPILMPIPGQWKVIGFEPDKLVLNQTRAMAVSRILSGLGIDPMVLGFPSENKTYSNYQEAHEAAVENCLLPLLKLIADAYTAQHLTKDYDQAQRVRFRASWDLSNVRALQPDLDKLWERVGKAWERSLITRKEAKAELKLKASSDDDVYYSDLSAAPAEKPKDSALEKSLKRWKQVHAEI